MKNIKQFQSITNNIANTVHKSKRKQSVNETQDGKKIENLVKRVLS